MEQIRAALERAGQPSYRLRQIEEWLWQRDAQSYDEMTNLPAELRALLAQEAPLMRAETAERLVSIDGTRKYFARLADGEHVEVVGLPAAGSSTKERLTVCASTQIGCAMGCTFCATGEGGFVRDLSAFEIADTVALVARDFGRRVSNVVLMGQGEPFANYDASLEALRILNAPHAFGIGARHLTVSTCGLIAGIERFATEPEQFTLAVSLHSAVQATRDALMPGVVGQPLDELRRVLIAYFAQTGRRPSLECTLIADVNDTPAEVEALGRFAADIGAHVNLISLNPVTMGAEAQCDNFTEPLAELGRDPLAQQVSSSVSVDETVARRSDMERGVCKIRCRASAPTSVATTLRTRFGVETTVRTPRGVDIDGACGQLYARKPLAV